MCWRIVLASDIKKVYIGQPLFFFTWPAGDEAHGVRCWKTLRCASKADVRQIKHSTGMQKSFRKDTSSDMRRSIRWCLWFWQSFLFNARHYKHNCCCFFSCTGQFCFYIMSSFKLVERKHPKYTFKCLFYWTFSICILHTANFTVFFLSVFWRDLLRGLFIYHLHWFIQYDDDVLFSVCWQYFLIYGVIKREIRNLLYKNI